MDKSSARCLKCGMPKSGPLVTCPKCNHTPEDPKDQEAHQRAAAAEASRKWYTNWGVDLWGVVMNVVQIAGMAVTIVLLKRFTPLPFWACILIGIPLFLVVFLGSLSILFGRR